MMVLWLRMSFHSFYLNALHTACELFYMIERRRVKDCGHKRP